MALNPKIIKVNKGLGKAFDAMLQSPKFNYLQQMDIILRMEAKLAGDGNMVRFALKQAVCNKKLPAAVIIKETQEMIHDNYNAIADILGKVLTDKIKNFTS